MIDTNPIKKKEDIKPTEAGSSFLVNPNEAAMLMKRFHFQRMESNFRICCMNSGTQTFEGLKTADYVINS